MAANVEEIERELQAWYGRGEDGDPPARVSSVALLGSGYDTDVFTFAVEHRRGGGAAPEELVLRIYGGEGCSEKAEREFNALGRLRDAGYPVPKVLGLRREGTRVAGPCIVMERIRGAALEWNYWQASEEERPNRRGLLSRLLARLHSLDGRGILPDSPLGGSTDPYAFIDFEVDTLREMRSRLDGGEPRSMQEAVAWLCSRRPPLPGDRPVVVHGDFHPTTCSSARTARRT